MAEMVKHPKHYQSDNGLECWDAMEMIFGRWAVLAFCQCNILKYLWRLGKKDDRRQELAKVAEYQRKADSLRSGKKCCHRDIKVLQKVKRWLLDMADDLDREITDMILEEGGKND